MTVLEERIDALEEFLLATRSLDAFHESAKRIAEMQRIFHLVYD